MQLNPIKLGEFFACSFFAVLFLQSGLDKVWDFRGNLSYMTGHFEKSSLAFFTPFLLGVMTVLEVVTGLASAAGAVCLIARGPHWLPVLSVSLACTSFLCLFAGQRIAKDYAGAATLAIYFGVSLVSLGLLSLGG